MRCFVRMKKIAAVLALAMCVGCSTVESSAPAAEVSAIFYQFYLTRSSMQSTEFEQYKLTPRGLYYECGVIHRGRPEVRSQGIQVLEAERLLASRELAQKISTEMDVTPRPLLDPPGTNAGFADPGKFLLILTSGGREVEIKTSLDGVEKARRKVEAHAKSFAETVRGSIPTPLCGNHDFYGIGRR